MGRFIVAHIIDDHSLGQRFTLWPLHVTILPPFEAENLNQVLEYLRPIALETGEISVELNGTKQFGKHTVQMLEASYELVTLHKSCLHAAEENNWEMSGRYTGSAYTPHITRKAGREHKEERVIINQLTIVESQPMGYREVVAVLPLGNGNAVVK